MKHIHPDILAALPDQAIVNQPTTGEPVRVVKGASGFWPYLGHHDRIQSLNQSWGADDEAVQEAMLIGSLFGWEVPGVDPALYRRTAA